MRAERRRQLKYLLDEIAPLKTTPEEQERLQIERKTCEMDGLPLALGPEQFRGGLTGLALEEFILRHTQEIIAMEVEDAIREECRSRGVTIEEFFSAPGGL